MQVSSAAKSLNAECYVFVVGSQAAGLSVNQQGRMASKSGSDLDLAVIVPGVSDKCAPCPALHVQNLANVVAAVAHLMLVFILVTA